MAINVPAFGGGVPHYHGTPIMHNNGGLAEQFENIAKRHQKK
jgi:hypothetical protein